MKILSIIIKEFIINLRDYKANAMMVLFPIVLIAILGTAFNGVFSGSIEFDDTKVLYKVEAKDNAVFATAFESFSSQLSKETGIVFEKTDDFEGSKAGVEDKTYSAFVHIRENPLQIDIYRNERSGLDMTLLENSIASFIESYDGMMAIAGNNPAALGMARLQEYKGHVQVRSLDKKRQPGSMDYYAVTMLTLILFYSSLTGFWAIRNEVVQNTASRILCAPVHSYELLTGKVIGSIFVSFIQGLVVLLFSKLVMKTYWGEDLLSVVLLISSYAIMTTCLGVAIAFLIKSSEAASGILNTIIPIFVFLGGGYVPLYVMGGTISDMSVISPVKWINSALFGIIFDGNYSDMFVSIPLNLGLAALFIAISVLFSRRRDRAYA